MSSGLAGLLAAATQQLSAVCEHPRDEAEWLLAELLVTDRSRLRFRDEPLSAAQQSRYADWLARRAAGEPLAYVIGTQPFRRLTLHLTPDVLIPRVDTGVLVDWALQILAAQPPAARVLDACTGSGCVALALADEAPGHDITGSDCSPAALAVALANAARLQLGVRFIEADALALPLGTPPFQLITANPPYIAEGDPHLPALSHEPLLALVSGVDGLVLLRRLVGEAPARLTAGGWLLLEHGYQQGEAVRTLLRQRGFTAVETRLDDGGNERVTGGQWSAAHG
ncbi:MAG: peptide chain release factor N(5)-glutamine methyltransferase [Pseudomonadota bacterium]